MPLNLNQALGIKPPPPDSDLAKAFKEILSAARTERTEQDFEASVAAIFMRYGYDDEAIRIIRLPPIF